MNWSSGREQTLDSESEYWIKQLTVGLSARQHWDGKIFQLVQCVRFVKLLSGQLQPMAKINKK